jgi:hypothetical protein
MKEIFFSAPFFFSKIIPRPSAKISIITYQLFLFNRSYFYLVLQKKIPKVLFFTARLLYFFIVASDFFVFGQDFFCIFIV